MSSSIQSAVKEVAQAASFLQQPASLAFMEQVSVALVRCFEEGNKVLVAGNGGSLCDAMHIAEEFTGQFRARRKPLPAIALADPSHMSCTANDMGFSFIFSRLVEAYGKKGDILILLTTSGKSSNLVEAHRVARQSGLVTVTFSGKGGGDLQGESDLEWIVQGFRYSDRIQELHMAAAHIIIEEVERRLFSLGISSCTAVV